MSIRFRKFLKLGKDVKLDIGKKDLDLVQVLKGQGWVGSRGAYFCWNFWYRDLLNQLQKYITIHRSALEASRGHEITASYDYLIR